MSAPETSAFPPVGLNDGPLFRYNTADSNTSGTEALALPDAAPRGSVLPSEQLIGLRDRISDSVTRPSTRRVLASMTPNASIKRQLKSASPSGQVKRTFTHNQALHKKLEAHRGPVIILDANGYPKYMFEYKGGEWRGFNAIDNEPLSADKSSPAKMMAHMVKTHAPGTVFTFYDLGYDKEVGRERLYLDDEDDASINGARLGGIENDDTHRLIEERQPLIRTTASSNSGLDNVISSSPTRNTHDE